MHGCVTVPAAKNSVLPITAASLMLDGESIIKKCPALLDVNTSVDIINSLGCKADCSDGNLHITYCENENCTIDKELCKKMRSSILYLAPILYRRGKVSLCYPGGCNLGKRQIDIHLAGLEKMGAEVKCEDDCITVSVPNGLKGTTFRLHTASVGATQTLLMAASVAKGITVLRNCACEPEVADLAQFLRCAGAKITGAGKSEIIVQGVPFLSAVEYIPIADRIFAATILSAVNACKGVVFIKNYPDEYMHKFEKLLAKTGLKVIHFAESAVAIKIFNVAADIKVHTGYYPAFPTDMGPLLSAALINNNGTLTLTEGVFENRFSYISEFEKLGLCCETDNREYYQTAGTDNFNADLKASDLRAGAAIVVAALAKRGKFTIEGLEYIDRGYEKIEEIFSSLNGDIRRYTFERTEFQRTEKD